MERKRGFIFLESWIFLVMAIITVIEIFSFGIFEQLFVNSKMGISWFIGLSFGVVFSSFLKSVGKRFKIGAIEKRKEYFFFFLINLIISISLVTLIKNLAISFFNQFFIYFHVLFLQWIMILYITFKINNNYEMSAKHIFTNELIILINTILIIIFIA